MENLECFDGQLIEEQHRYRLVDKQHYQNRVQNFKSRIPFHNFLLPSVFCLTLLAIQSRRRRFPAFIPL
jgi:hypothetical protein